MEKFDIVGLGNALLDLQIEVPERSLVELGINKASMQLVGADQQASIFEKLSKFGHPIEQSSGGCTANTLAGVASFGGKTHLFAKLGNDEHGRYYIQDLQNSGISHSTEPHASLASGSCLALITPDAERTMLTHLGAAQELSAFDIQADIIQSGKLIYLEGYLWDSPKGKAACEHAAEIAIQAGKKVALTLSDSLCVQRHLDEFRSFVKAKVDVLFCNEAEALMFTQTNEVSEAFQSLKGLCEFVFVSVGARGALLSANYGKEIESVGTWDVRLVDKLGAGDLFAAGVLYGLSQNRNLRECGYLGCYAATKVIQQFSARIRTALSEELDIALKGPDLKAAEAIRLQA